MSSSLYRRNDALLTNGNTVNGKTADITITSAGSSFYYAVCAIMGFTSLTVLGLSYLKPRNDRIFFYVTSALNATACIAYFAMGSNLGFTPIDVEFSRTDPRVSGVMRSIFYARYIDWVVTTPLLLLDLLLTAGLRWQSILWVLFLDEAMIVTGLIGALTRSSYKWGFYVFGCVAMFGVFYELLVTARSHAKLLGKDIYRVFLMCGILTLFIWLLYPIAWGVSEGANLISPNSEAVFYGILDLIAKPVFSALLIWGHWNIDTARLGIPVRDPADQARNVPDYKGHNHVNNNNTSNGITTGSNLGGTNNNTVLPTNNTTHNRQDYAMSNLQSPEAGYHGGQDGEAPVYDNVTLNQRRA